MKLTIESTDTFMTIGGVETRIWSGRTEAGVEAVVFVARIAVHNDDDQSAFERELVTMPVPHMANVRVMR